MVISMEVMMMNLEAGWQRRSMNWFCIACNSLPRSKSAVIIQRCWSHWGEDQDDEYNGWRARITGEVMMGMRLKNEGRSEWGKEILGKEARFLSEVDGWPGCCQPCGTLARLPASCARRMSPKGNLCTRRMSSVGNLRTPYVVHRKPFLPTTLGDNHLASQDILIPPLTTAWFTKHMTLFQTWIELKYIISNFICLGTKIWRHRLSNFQWGEDH